MPNLRFRYSLLTLLILTALVASGVKLWYGPHRVTVGDPQLGSMQVEYTYYNNWRRDPVMIGPTVVRIFDANGNLSSVSAAYFRNGDELSDWYLIKYPPDSELENKEVDAHELSKETLHQMEQEEFLRTIISERTKLKEQYPGWKIRESLTQPRR